MSRLVIACDPLFDPCYCGWRRTQTPTRGGAMFVDTLKLSSTDVILDALASGRVQSTSTHQSLAERIMACFAALRIEKLRLHISRGLHTAHQYPASTRARGCTDEQCSTSCRLHCRSVRAETMVQDPSSVGVRPQSCEDRRLCQLDTPRRHGKLLCAPRFGSARATEASSSLPDRNC
jgi:hypothetical protein